MYLDCPTELTKRGELSCLSILIGPLQVVFILLIRREFRVGRPAGQQEFRRRKELSSIRLSPKPRAQTARRPDSRCRGLPLQLRPRRSWIVRISYPSLDGPDKGKFLRPAPHPDPLPAARCARRDLRSRPALCPALVSNSLGCRSRSDRRSRKPPFAHPRGEGATTGDRSSGRRCPRRQGGRGRRRCGRVSSARARRGRAQRGQGGRDRP